MTGGYVRPTITEIAAYEYVRGEKFPNPFRPQDIAVARTCVAIYRRDEKELVAQKRRATKAKRQRDQAIAGPMIQGDTAIPLEDDEQKAAAKWLDEQGLCWIHVPNEGKRSKRYGQGLKAKGLKRGFPDILIFTPPPNRPDVRFVAIELKRRKGGRVSDEQRQWLADLRENGGESRVCNGAAEVAWYCESLGYGEPRP